MLSHLKIQNLQILCCKLQIAIINLGCGDLGESPYSSCNPTKSPWNRIERMFYIFRRAYMNQCTTTKPRIQVMSSFYCILENWCIYMQTILLLLRLLNPSGHTSLKLPFRFTNVFYSPANEALPQVPHFQCSEVLEWSQLHLAKSSMLTPFSPSAPADFS